MERLTDHQIETLAEHWPWEYEEAAAALRLAEEEGWPLDDTVRALDRIAEEFGVCAHPVRVIKAAIAHQQIHRPRLNGPS
jgi:hypothetical protein